MENPNKGRIAVYGAIFVFFIFLLKTAWLCDDAFILFRTVDNFIHGYGLRWNVAERVQTFTCPLWMFLVSAVYFITHEIYYTSLFLSLFVSMIAVTLAGLKVNKDNMLGGFAAVCILLSSKGFLEYSTSGLENAMTHLLMVLFFLVYSKPEYSPGKIFLLSLIASSSVLNRMDTMLFYLPALCYVGLRNLRFRTIGMVFLGFTPFFAWEVFSVIYYGFAFPNTAYAKLGSGVAQAELFQQGFFYYLHACNTDPVSLLAILLGLTLCFGCRNRYIPLGLGVFLYLVYILRIGGDFMGNRFFAAPVLMCALLLAAIYEWKENFLIGGLLGLILLLGIFSSLSNWQSSRMYGEEDPQAKSFVNGIADERRYYYPEYGLLKAGRIVPIHTQLWKYYGWRAQHDRNRPVFLTGAVGLMGFYAGPGSHIVDENALGDPLLARLPALYDPTWRIGHFKRALPEGYMETILSGENKIPNEGLARYYEELRWITRGPIFSRERWKAVWNMNLGRYDSWLDPYAYRFGSIPHVPLSRLTPAKAEGSDSNAADNLTARRPGLIVQLGGDRHEKWVELNAEQTTSCLLVFLHKGKALEKIEAPVRKLSQEGLSIRFLPVPPKAADEGYDEILLYPLIGDDKNIIGHLRLFP